MSGPPDSFPHVCVVIPTRDRPVLLRRSIEAIIHQDYPGKIDIVVVYDGRPPDALSYEAPLRCVRTMSNTRTPGPAGSRNSGIFDSRGDLVALCDDDDVWAPDKLRLQVDALVAHPKAEMVGCGVLIDVLGELKVRLPAGEWLTRQDLIEKRSLCAGNSSVLMTRKLTEGTGGFDEAIPGSYGEDYDLFLRVAKRHPILMVQDPLVTLLWGPTSYFAERWETIERGLKFLLDKHPDLVENRRGFARIAGQIAFAAAAQAHRRDSVGWALKAIEQNPLEVRSYLALAVAGRFVSARRIIKFINRRGRGI